MIVGCLKSAFALVGCATLLVAGGIVAYEYREQIAGAARSVLREVGHAEETDGAAGEAVGWPSAESLRSAKRKRAAMARTPGPAYVVFTPDEMASLIEQGLEAAARAALDSLHVVVSGDRFALRASLRTSIFGRELLGPFEGLLEDREPLEMAGPARFARTGVIAWQPDHFRLRAFPFPRALVPRLVNRLTGRDDGTVPILVPGTVGDVRIRADGITFYRRTD